LIVVKAFLYICLTKTHYSKIEVFED